MYRTYIQQIFFDGVSYTRGPVVDILEKYNVACSSFPFRYLPEAKELPARDWFGEDGRDVYIPKNIPMKNYDLDVVFLYKGTERTIYKDIPAFIDFLYGRNEGAVGGQLVVYDEFLKMGRKDVHVLSIEADVYDATDVDPDAVGLFKAKFSVEDPTTEVIPKVGANEGGKMSIVGFDFKKK